MCILIQSWISPPTVFRHWIFSGLYLSDEISNIPGLYCMPTAPLSAWFGNIKPIASISEESAPCARICNVLEAISISLLLQCCSSRCTRWKLVTPEALCWGILEEEACQCFHRHRNRLCQKGIFSCLLCPNVSHWGCAERGRLLPISGVLLCWWQGLTVFSSSWDLTFSNLLLVGPGVPKLTAHRWRGVLLEASNRWEVQGSAVNPAREESMSWLLLDASPSRDALGS